MSVMLSHWNFGVYLLVVFLTVNFYEFQITFPTVDSSLLYKNSGWQSGNGILRMKMLVLA